MKAIEKDAAGQFRAFNAHVLFILQRHVDQKIQESPNEN